jgi:hypothetical protein
MDNAVYCVARDRAHAESIVDRLKSAGFSSNEISVLMSDKSGTRDFAEDKDTKAPEAATTGAGAGLGLGAVLGWLAGIGSLAIPGVGPLIAAGPIMGAIGGAAAGTVAGGVIGGLVGLGIPEEDAKNYEGRIRGGGVLVSVHTENATQLNDAKDIFDREGASDIRSTSQQFDGRGGSAYQESSRPRS